MKYQASMPPVAYFLSTDKKTNIWTGSIGTDPVRGLLKSTTLQYRITLKQEEDKNSLHAVWYIKAPWRSENPGIEGEKDSDFSQEGLDSLKKYLEEEYEKNVPEQK